MPAGTTKGECMEAALTDPQLSLEATLEQRRREVLLERVRAVARRSPEVLASVIQQWIDQDRAVREHDGLEMYRRRRKILEQTEWQAHFRARSAERAHP
ncbi:MAG: hypothetical protein KGJ86_05710 [Chloroflexota bacterium]|nr:hypothetical protein [Chloroflexota bacterium]